MPSRSHEREQALEAIRVANEGILRAQDVVDAARAEESPLHDWFEWDDSVAAENHRRQQARELIRVYVKVEKQDTPETRAYVSLESDRRSPGGGYRSVSDVFTNPERRAELLTQALREASLWRTKYKALEELAGVFDAIEAAQQTTG